MSQAESEQEAPTFDKDNPFAAKITENRLLNKEGSSKDTRHFVVDISGSGLKYTCGDSIGIYPTNDSAYVENVLSTLNFTGDEMVVVPKVDRALPLRAALMHKLSLAGPSKGSITKAHCEEVDELAPRTHTRAIARSKCKRKFTTVRPPPSRGRPSHPNFRPAQSSGSANSCPSSKKAVPRRLRQGRRSSQSVKSKWARHACR